MAEKEITFETADNSGSIKIANEVVMTIASQAVNDIKGASIASTLAEEVGVPKGPSSASLLKEAIHVISCGYEDKTEWGKEV